MISKLSDQSRVLGSHFQILISPPKPTDAAVRPSLPRGPVAMWCVPSLCAVRDCAIGKVPLGSLVRWTLMVDEPLPERSALEVAASANMSVVWAAGESGLVSDATA